jgi:hypothetical protein
VSATAPMHVTSHWYATSEFSRSLPLFFAATIFFVAGGILRFGFPSDANYGPGAFTFWALLLALGFTCTIGGVISWTLGGEPTTPLAVESTPALTPAYLPIEFPEAAARVPTPAPTRAGRARSDYGRPVPEVRAVAADGDFYEGPSDSERFEGPADVLPIEVVPVVAPEADGAPSGVIPAVEEVLADLERIERDLAPRARTTEPSSA